MRLPRGIYGVDNERDAAQARELLHVRNLSIATHILLSNSPSGFACRISHVSTTSRMMFAGGMCAKSSASQKSAGLVSTSSKSEISMLNSSLCRLGIARRWNGLVVMSEMFAPGAELSDKVSGE